VLSEPAAVDNEPLARLHRTLLIGVVLLGIVAFAVVTLTFLVALQVRTNRATRAESAARQACRSWTSFTNAPGFSPLADTPAHQQALQSASQRVQPPAAKAARLDGANWERLFEDAANVVSNSARVNNSSSPNFIARDQGNLVTTELDLGRECTKF
jgi:hypothetical protein